MKLFRDGLILSAACIENITATLQDPNKLGGFSNWWNSIPAFRAPSKKR